MERFEFGVGDLLAHKGCLGDPPTAGAWRLVVTACHAQCDAAGRSNSYDCTIVSPSGKIEGQANFLEAELVPWDAYAGAMKKHVALAFGVAELLKEVGKAVAEGKEQGETANQK